MSRGSGFRRNDRWERTVSGVGAGFKPARFGAETLGGSGTRPYHDDLSWRVRVSEQEIYCDGGASMGISVVSPSAMSSDGRGSV